MAIVVVVAITAMVTTIMFLDMTTITAITTIMAIITTTTATIMVITNHFDLLIALAIVWQMRNFVPAVDIEETDPYFKELAAMKKKEEYTNPAR